MLCTSRLVPEATSMHTRVSERSNESEIGTTPDQTDTHVSIPAQPIMPAWAWPARASRPRMPFAVHHTEGFFSMLPHVSITMVVGQLVFRSMRCLDARHERRLKLPLRQLQFRQAY